LRTSRLSRPPIFFCGLLCPDGLLDEARATIARLRAITPVVLVNDSLPFRDPQHRKLYLSGVRPPLGGTT